MGNNTDRDDNNQLVQHDMDNATNEQKIAWLYRIIDNEIKKPEDKTDSNLILECYDCIAELTPDDERLTSDELAVRLEKIKVKRQRSTMRMV